MERNVRIFAALAIGLMSSALVPSLKASELDKRTTITITQPITVEGTILPAGHYVLKLRDSSSTLDVVYVFNGDETRLITTVLAIHAERLRAPDNSEFSFYESQAGQPAALHTWFYPGDPSGFEFLQPQQTVAAGSSTALAAPKKMPTPSRKPTAAAGPSAAGG
jgi:hypothetical protein